MPVHDYEFIKFTLLKWLLFLTEWCLKFGRGSRLLCPFFGLALFAFVWLFSDPSLKYWRRQWVAAHCVLFMDLDCLSFWTYIFLNLYFFAFLDLFFFYFVDLYFLPFWTYIYFLPFLALFFAFLSQFLLPFFGLIPVSSIGSVLLLGVSRLLSQSWKPVPLSEGGGGGGSGILIQDRWYY